VQELVTFKSTNAVEDEEDQLELEKDLKTATLCWANDFRFLEVILRTHFDLFLWGFLSISAVIH
jgi:hypothetical protein